jgi:hypothetical protein
MSTARQIDWNPHILALALILLGTPFFVFAASTTAVLDAGGRRVSSANYSIDGSLGSIGGISSAAVPAVTARHGYAGQLYDVQSLALSASLTNVNETGTRQLGIKAILDDATFLSLAATSVAWSVVSGPIASISASGLATTTNVYQDTSATVRADYQSKFGTLPLTVLNVGTDDFGLYAHDGIDDAWQVRYFGLNKPQGGPFSDPDGDGMRNEVEFIADTNPTNAASCFRITAVSNLPPRIVYFKSSADRAYTLISVSNLSSGVWSAVPGAGPRPGIGGQDFLSDTNIPPKGPFYWLKVELP